MHLYYSKVKTSLLFQLLILFFCSQIQAQEKAVSYPYDASYHYSDFNIKLEHLDAKLLIKPYDTLVDGRAVFQFSMLSTSSDSIIFNVPELKISSVLLDGSACSYSLSGNSAIIRLPGEFKRGSKHSLAFGYKSKPTDGLYFIGWNDPKQLKRKQIWAHRPDHWIPYFPGINTVNMDITVEKELKVYTNGIREGITENTDGTRTWHYAMKSPHPFFSTCLVIGDMEYTNATTARGLPLEFWYYPNWKDHVEPTFRYTTRMFDFFEDQFGLNYPYELYRESPVVDYMYGAMETTTATIFGDYLMVDKRGYLGRNYVNVNSHELAHQWFGNYISHLKGKDLWLTETFATYWAKRFEEHIFGEDYYEEVRNKELAETLEAALHDNYAVGHYMGGRNRWYPKGSLVMDMLRDVLGDENFRASIKLYLESFPYQTAETYDLLQCIRKATGRSLEWFFEEWIYRGGEPHFKVKYEPLTDINGKASTHVQVEQIQEINEISRAFQMPVKIQVHYADGTMSEETNWIRKPAEEILISNPESKKLAFVIFDPGRRIIKKLSFDRSYNELNLQASQANQMIDRYDALLAMKSMPSKLKQADLIQRYYKETYSMIRGEIIAQLCDSLTDASIAVLKEAVRDTNDKVRLAVVQNLKVIPIVLEQDIASLLKDPAYLTIQLAQEKLCKSFPSKYRTYLDITKNETGWRGLNIRISWLEIAISNGERKYCKELVDYTSPSYEFETRINAANALRRLNLLTNDATINLMEGASHWNYKIKAACMETLKYFYQQDNYQNLIVTVALSSNHQSILELFSGSK